MASFLYVPNTLVLPRLGRPHDIEGSIGLPNAIGLRHPRLRGPTTPLRWDWDMNRLEKPSNYGSETHMEPDNPSRRVVEEQKIVFQRPIFRFQVFFFFQGVYWKLVFFSQTGCHMVVSQWTHWATLQFQCRWFSKSHPQCSGWLPDLVLWGPED